MIAFAARAVVHDAVVSCVPEAVSTFDPAITGPDA